MSEDTARTPPTSAPDRRVGVSLRTFVSRLIWLCMGPLVLLALYLVVAHVHAVHAHQDEAAERLGATLTTAVEQIVSTRIAALSALAASPQLDDEAGLDDFYRLAQGFRGVYGQIHVALVDAATMSMRLSTRVPMSRPLPTDAGPFNAAVAPQVLQSGRPVVSDLYAGAVSGVPVVAVAVPVWRQGVIRWLLVATADAAQIDARLAERKDIPAGWGVSLLDRQGVAIARRAPAGFDSRRDVDEDGRFITRSQLTGYSVVVEIPRAIQRGPMVAAGLSMAGAALGAIALGLIGGLWARGLLSRDLTALARPGRAGETPSRIEEIAQARGLLDDVASQRAAADALLRASEQRFRRTFHEAPVAQALLDRQDRVLDVNARFVELFGYGVDELPDYGAWVARMYPDAKGRAEAAAQREQALAALRTAERRFDAGETTVRCKDGSQRIVITSVGVVGEHLLVSWSDVTAHRRTEAALQASQAAALQAQQQARETAERLMRDALDARARAESANSALRMLSLAVEQSPEAIVISAVDGAVQYVNEAFVQSSGYSRDEVLGGLFPVDGLSDHLRDEIRATLADGRVWKGEMPSRRRDGTEYTEYAIVSPLRQNDGRITHYVSVKEDITEKKRIGGELQRHRDHLEDLVATRTAELEAARAAAESANRAKSEFLANMSHEIRTPLNAISGLTQLLSREMVDPRTLDRLGKIGDAAQHLLQVISDILDLSKIEAGQLELEQIHFSPAEVLSGVTAMIADRAQAKGLTLRVEPAALPATLRGDPTRLTQALTNLLSNAVKFTERGHVTLTVDVLPTDDRHTCLTFRVRDTGVGIAPDALRRLFAAFVQADPSTTRRFGGTGLGLAITQRLATMMGGQVGARSEPGVGSEFWFTACFQPGAAPTTERGRRAPAADAEGLLRLNCGGARALVVEDNLVNQEVAAQLLQAVGLRVDVAGDGAQAVALAARESFDLVLMDMQMPTMDGLEAAARIRALPGQAALPIIAMTANAFGEDRAACLAAGMNDYLSKPVQSATLYHAVLRWLPSRAHGSAGGLAAAGVDDGISPPAGSGELPLVDGLDVERGLAFMGGRVDLYVHALRRFVERYGQADTELAEALAAGDRRRMQHLTHSLCGAAATLGAGRLADLAAACESALAARGIDGASDDVTGPLQREWRTVAEGLQRWLATAPVAAPTP